MKILSSTSFFLLIHIFYISSMEDPHKHKVGPKISAHASAALELLINASIDTSSTIINGDNDSQAIKNQIAHFYPNTLPAPPNMLPPTIMGRIVSFLFVPAPRVVATQRVLVSVSRFMAAPDKKAVLKEFCNKIKPGEQIVIGTLGAFFDDHPLIRSLRRLALNPQWAKISTAYRDFIITQGNDNYKIPDLFDKKDWGNCSFEYGSSYTNTYDSKQEFCDWITEWMGAMPSGVQEPFDQKAFCEELVQQYVGTPYSQSEDKIVFKFYQMIIQATKK